MAVLAEAADSREWQDVLRISEDLRQAVCRIHAKLASERELLLAERAAAAAEKAAAAAEREQAERLVRMISAAADRCNALTGAKEATQPSGRAMPGPSTAAPKGVVVKQPPQRPAQSTHAAPTNGSHPLAAPPMPSRSPPPAQNQVESTEVPGAVPRVKAPPNQGRRAASSVPAVAPEASKETGDSARTACSVKVQSQEWGSTGSSSGLLATPQCKENDVREDTQEAPAQDTPKRSKSSKDEAVTEEAAGVASANESCNGTRVEPLLDDLEEDEMDEHELWAMNAPSPPSKAHPTESPHYRVMPPPRADPLPTDPFPVPDSDELETGRSLSPEEDREYATEEAFESEMERGAEDSAVSRVPVKAMPGRDGPSSSAWPVGKAAASRYKAPPAALFGSSASSSDRRETSGSEAQPAASSVATPEASAGLTTSSVKAPPHRSTPSG